jgi:hypothetical protein
VLLHLVLADTEFPNDNPWLGDPCGVLSFAKDADLLEEEPPASPIESTLEPAVEPTPLMVEPAPLAVEPAPPVTELGSASPEPTPVAPRESGFQLRAEPFAPPSAEVDAEDPEDIEVVEEFEDFETVALAVEQESVEDPFAVFVRTLVEVAENAGCPMAAALLPALLRGGDVVTDGLSEAAVDALIAGGVLARTSSGLVSADTLRATACAWRAILCGKSEDFSACGSRMLDEWAADLVARIIASPAKTEQLRRELRARGVAAFGLVLAA